MATHAAIHRTIWAAGYDMTGDANQLSWPLTFDELDDTRYGMTARSRIAGFENAEATVAGFWQGGDDAVDAHAFSALTGRQLITGAEAPDEGSVAYFMQARQLSYELGGQVGEVLPFTLSAKSTKGNGTLSAGTVRGRVLKTKGAVDATGATGTAYELGAVADGEYLYAALHVFEAGTTITVIIQSDEDGDFGSPTTRATIGPVTVAGGYWATRVAGPVTDTFYRVNVSAITGEHTIACVAGIK